MQTNLYVIYDLKAGIYNKPFYMVNDAVVIRTMEDLLTDPGTDICKHPEDFIVYQVGSFEDTTCKFDLLDHPRILGKAIEIQSQILSRLNTQQTAKES